MGLSFKELVGLDPVISAAGASYSGERGEHSKFKGSSILDPLDLFGYRSGRKLDEQMAAQQAATQAAIQSREEMFRKSMAVGAPYREMGYAALPKLQASLQEGGPLDRLRSNITRKFMSGYLQKQGFDPKVSGAITGKRLRKTMAAEDVSRRGRARDLMALGAGQTAQGAGMAGAQGASQARNIMAAAAAQSNLLAQRSQAKQAQMGALMYGGQRFAGDYIAKREADRYGGYYG
jgi:hypothetical protein